ncbi:MAG: DUF4340 domain-containing protein [Clostridiales bacterium]|nr:DUF4340 domain-containing protein [Clostridiales bacterium]
MYSFKKLLIPFIIMMVLIIGLIVWVIVKPKDNADLEDLNTVRFVDHEASDVVSLTVTSRDGSSLRIDSSDDTEEPYILIGYEDSDIDSSKLASYISVLSSFVSDKVIDDPAPLSEYGLDDPMYTVSITVNDGTVTTVLLGDTTPDGSYIYAKTDGDSKVYTVTSLKRDYCEYTYLNFLIPYLMHVDYSNVSGVSFERMSDGTHIEADCTLDSSGGPLFTVTYPYNIRASAYFTNLIDSVANMEVISFMDIEDDALSDYGLDEPSYRIVFNVKHGEDIVVELTSGSGIIYGRCSESEHEFSVAASTLSYLNTSVLDLLSYYVAYYTASELSSITCVYGDRSFRMDLDTPGSITDEDGTVTIDGRNCRVTTSEGRSYMAILFESIACIEIGGFDTDADPVLTDSPFMTITIITKSHETVRLAFEQRGTDSYYVFIDDAYSGFYIYSDELFEDGGTDTYSYGIWAAYDLINNAIMNSVNGIYDIPSEVTETLEGAA